MAEKRIWLTYLPETGREDRLPSLIRTLERYGFKVDGGLWDRDVKRFGWSAHRGPLLDPEKADAWCVASGPEELRAREIRYGLSMLVLDVLSERPGLPSFLLSEGPVPEELPHALRRLEPVDASASGWAARLLAGLQRFRPAPGGPYRLSAHAHEFIGQWFEIGPAEGEWKGAVLGVDQGEITHHGVGPSGFPPERSVVEYPLRGLKMEVGGTEFTAWAVQNTIGPGESYYVKVVGQPGRLALGEHPELGPGEVFVFSLS